MRSLFWRRSNADRVTLIAAIRSSAGVAGAAMWATVHHRRATCRKSPASELGGDPNVRSLVAREFLLFTGLSELAQFFALLEQVPPSHDVDGEGSNDADPAICVS